MTLGTHKTGGVATALLLTPVVYNYFSPDMSYIFALGICCYFAKIGAELPDLDLPWDNIKKKNSLWRSAVNRILWAIGCKHRSWQTHCYTLTLAPFVIVASLILASGLNAVNKEVIFWITGGLAIGILSHLILDSFNPQGTYIIPKVKIRFIPKKLAIVTGSVEERWITLFCIGLGAYGAYSSFELLKTSVISLVSLSK